MSRRAMILLILAIIAVHGILLWLVVATGDNEQKIADTRKQIEEGNALLSEMEDEIQSVEQKDPTPTVQKPDTGVSTSKPETNTAQGASTQPKPATAQPSASTQPPASTQPKTAATTDKDPLAGLPAEKEKPAPSVPSTTYVRKPRKTVVPKLDFTGAARDDISGLKGISLSTAGILIDMDTNKVLWAKNPSKPVPVASSRRS